MKHRTVPTTVTAQNTSNCAGIFRRRLQGCGQTGFCVIAPMISPPKIIQTAASETQNTVCAPASCCHSQRR